SAGVAAPSALLEDAVAYARSRGAVVVAAAGNETLSRALYPARTRGALGVAASRENHRLSLNTPLDGAIELAAPGDEVLTTVPLFVGGGKGVMAGSSMSAAFVAGTAALCFGTGAQPDDVLRVLRGARHAFPLLADHGRFLPIGELDAALALSRLDSAARTIDSVHSLPAVARPGSTLDVRVRVRASGGRVATGGSLVVNGVAVALPALPADGSAVEVSVKVTSPEDGKLLARLDDDVRATVLPVARAAKVSKLQIVEMSLDEMLRVTVENQGELAEEVSVGALAEKDFLRGEAARRVEAGARATFSFALPELLPEVCRFEARVNEVAAAGRLDVRMAGKDPRPVRPLYQQSGDVDLVADAPWRLEPDRTYLPVMLFAPSKGDSGRGIDLAIDSTTIFSLDKPNAVSGGQLYTHVRGARATATPGTELTDEDGNVLASVDAFQNKVLSYNGAYEVFRFPRAAFGVQLRPSAPTMRFVDVRMTWTAHRSAWFGLSVATDKGTYKKVLGVNFAARALPVLPGDGRYYDTHVHTIAEWYITSPYDLLAPKKAYGGPLTMLREAAFALGLTSQLDPGPGRIVTTDHSCFYNEQDPKANTEARRVQVGPSSPSKSTDASGRVKPQLERFREMFGVSANEEVCFDQAKKVLVVGIPLGAHMLSFRGPHWEENWNGGDGGGSPNVRQFGKGALSMEEILDTLATKAPDQNKDAFLYSAHPFSSQGWNDESMNAGLELQTTATGRRSGKTINAKTQNFVVKGHQLWNGRTARELPSSKIDWYDLNPWIDTQWVKGHDNTAKAVESGLKTYHDQLSSLLRYETDQEPGRVFVRKLYVAAGSDAHGDFNYCEERLATPLNVSITYGVSDNAFAKARTYVLEDGVPGQVERGMVALANGNTIVTDGPLAKLAFDANAHFDSQSLVYHAGSASFENEDGRIGGGGAGPDGARTALVVAKSGDARWRYR
ncbi:MAG: S8 family serine peptidase, partial [Planctomycetota bacterium]